MRYLGRREGRWQEWGWGGGDGTCCRRGLEEEATLTAVTLVMKDSMSSTVSLVAAMMKASHPAFSAPSSSFLLSTWGPPPHLPCSGAGPGIASPEPGGPSSTALDSRALAQAFHAPTAQQLQVQ